MTRSRQRRTRHALASLTGTLALVAGVGLVALAPPAQAAPTPLISEQSGRCLDVSGNDTTPGSTLQIWDCNGVAGQRWSTGSTTAPSAPTAPSDYPGPGVVTGATWAHDPTVVKRPDGSYLVATTGRGIPLKTSPDRTSWRDVGAAFPNGTPWTSNHTTGDLWAPDLSYRNGQYYLYYSASTFGSSHSGIYLATSPSGNPGTWTNRGLVVSTTSSSNYNAIDPDLIVDQQGRWFLSFGSFWSGLKVISIDPATGLRSGTAMTSIASRSGGIEAPDIYHRDGYYYLFVSVGACCRGADSTYRIAVGRSTSVTGPYVDRSGTPMMNGGGTEILAGRGSVHGPGHSATLTDGDGTILFYHYYNDAGTAQLGINRLTWDAAGWPVVS